MGKNFIILRHVHEEQNWKCRIFIFRQRLNDSFRWLFGAFDFLFFVRDTSRELTNFLLSFIVFLIIFRRGSSLNQMPIPIVLSITRIRSLVFFFGPFFLLLIKIGEFFIQYIKKSLLCQYLIPVFLLSICRLSLLFFPSLLN